MNTRSGAKRNKLSVEERRQTHCTFKKYKKQRTCVDVPSINNPVRGHAAQEVVLGGPAELQVQQVVVEAVVLLEVHLLATHRRKFLAHRHAVVGGAVAVHLAPCEEV